MLTADITSEVTTILQQAVTELLDVCKSTKTLHRTYTHIVHVAGTRYYNIGSYAAHIKQSIHNLKKIILGGSNNSPIFKPHQMSLQSILARENTYIESKSKNSWYDNTGTAWDIISSAKAKLQTCIMLLEKQTASVPNSNTTIIVSVLRTIVFGEAFPLEHSKNFNGLNKIS